MASARGKSNGNRCRYFRYGGFAVRVIERREEPGVEHIQLVRRNGVFFDARKRTLRALAPLPKKYRQRIVESGRRVDEERERRARLKDQGIEVAPAWTDLRKIQPRETSVAPTGLAL